MSEACNRLGINERGFASSEGNKCLGCAIDITLNKFPLEQFCQTGSVIEQV
jgi:hypothetical protein